MLQSERLQYRIFSEEDFQLFMDIKTDPEIMRYAYFDRLISREEVREAFFETLLMQCRGRGMLYAAALKDTGTDIAVVDYEVIEQNSCGGICEIGYFIKKDYWGYGYGTEMGKAVIDEVFTNHPEMHKVKASCHANNLASEHIMKKLGMRKEGVFRKVRCKEGNWEDEIVYGLLREEWKS